MVGSRAAFFISITIHGLVLLSEVSLAEPLGRRVGAKCKTDGYEGSSLLFSQRLCVSARALAAAAAAGRLRQFNGLEVRCTRGFQAPSAVSRFASAAVKRVIRT